MASVESSAGDVIVFTKKPDKPPPPTTVGVLGWVRENLFYSWTSTITTFVAGYLIFITLAALYQWGIADAVWEAESRRQCLDTSPHGACWAGIIVWFNGMSSPRKWAQGARVWIAVDMTIASSTVIEQSIAVSQMLQNRREDSDVLAA